MTSKHKLNDKLVVYILSALLIVMASFAIVNVLTSYFSLGDPIVNKWDGVSVSSSFSSGNGSKENPYVIKSGDDLAYFKSLIEGLNSNTYNSAYYKLGNDIDLGDNSIEAIGGIIDTEQRYFKGVFDGNGYTIRNAKVIGKVVDNYEMHGLFSVLDGGSVVNINLEKVSIIPNQSSNPLMIGIIAGDIKEKSNIKNVSIYNSVIDLNATQENSRSKIGALVGNIDKDVNINNIYLNTRLASKYSNNVVKISHTSNSNLSNIVINISTDSLVLDNIKNFVENDNSSINNLYIASFSNGKLVIKKDSNEINIDKLISSFEEDIEEELYWMDDDGILKLARVISSENNLPPVNFAFGNSVLLEHETGVVGNTAYLNDLDSDYYNYIGKNFTWQNFSTTLPDGSDRGYYGAHNLVKTFIQYNGEDPTLENTTGYVSLNEQVSNFNYYKYYVLENGYITIELMDNPYADRPDDKAFGGWVSNYPGVEIWFDSEIHTYFARVPVTDVSTTVNIIFHARWVPATVGTVTSANNTSYNNAFSSLSNQGFKRFEMTYEINEDISNLWYKKEFGFFERVSGERYDSNFNYISSGNSTCYSSSCIYYIRNGNDEYDDAREYYEEVISGSNRTLVRKQVERIGHWDGIVEGESAAGYYIQRTFSRGNSVAGYYDTAGNYVKSGTCSSNSCTYYELLQYSDANGNPNLVNTNNTYYWMINRDTNILFVNTTSNITTNFWNSSSNTKPMTITGMHNGRAVNATFYMSSENASVSARADLRIEYVRLYTGSTPSDRTPTSSTNEFVSGTIKGNYYNLKIGRGISRNGNYLTAQAVIGGSNNTTGSSGTNTTKYRLILESGYYNNIGVVAGAIGTRTVYVDATAIYGSDFDRAVGEANLELMEVTQTAAGSWGGNVTSNTTGITTIVKYGSFGTDMDEYTYGIYVGALNGGSHSAVRTVTVEGGYIYNLIGGPCVSSNRGNVNDIFMNIKGGSIDFVVGGAGRTETYGNRLLNITGGVVNRAVYGGSNGYLGSSGEGILTGGTLVYVGGNAIIGSDEALAGRPSTYGEIVGSVYGVGNGRSGDSYANIGTAKSSIVIIDQAAQINGNVFGGGNYGAVGTDISTSTKTDINILGGTIVGSIYGGGNNNGAGKSSTTFNVNIEMYDGVVGNIYGGSRTKGIIYGNTNVNVYGGNVVSDVYGGGEGGYSNSTNPGTYVTGNSTVKIGRDLSSGATQFPLTINGSVYGGSAYGTVNGSSNNATVNTRLSTSVDVYYGTIIDSVFGGGKGDGTYTPKVLGPVTVNVYGGNIGSVYGGNDAAGQPSSTDYVYLNGGTIGNAFGGGNSTGQTTTNIFLQGATVTNLFGGSNINGIVTTANVSMSSGVISNIYGGNNKGTSTGTTKVVVSGGTINGDIYGGGMEAPVTMQTNVNITAPRINNVFGGGQKADALETIVGVNGSNGKKIFGGSNTEGTVSNSNVVIDGSAVIDSVYGGNNAGGITEKSHVTIDGGTIVAVYGGGDLATTGDAVVLVNSGFITNAFGGGNEAGLTTSDVNIYGGTVTNVYGGSNNAGTVGATDIVVGGQSSQGVPIIPKITNIYGGNNLGGTTGTTKVVVNSGTINDIYGGGNKAVSGTTSVVTKEANIVNIYGGGKAASVVGNTFLDIDRCVLNTNVFGGGDEGEVTGNTEAHVTDSTIAGSLYAGGNGTTATVHGNTYVTIDGVSVVGTPTSKTPYEGCVFGGGNKAFTGTEANGNSIAVVNIVGGHIYGNVYGGANTSVVYGGTVTNIGKNVVSDKNLKQADIIIGGTVFGGGEANAAGDDKYDFDFFSVVGSIDIFIDGTGYLSSGNRFDLSGSIFGSGNASSSSGTSNIFIKKLGTQENPSKNVSVQRTNNLVIDNSYMELVGVEDSTNDFASIKYSFNRIDKLVLKNNSALLLRKNANLLKEFYSGVDVNGNLVPAVVSIDDENKTVTKNVDNRIYMQPYNNLNITTTQDATSYGKVTGMTFFGMYDASSDGSLSYGLYNFNFNYGDATGAQDMLIGSSYVLGLHHANHDITVDGFYTNVFNEEMTEIITQYIEPSPPDSNFYRWMIGMQTINYTVDLTASKYSSLGTYNLTMLDFPDGDTKFEVLGFNSGKLNAGMNLVDPDEIPRIAENDEIANSTFGLAMKSETREWTNYGSTEFVSANGGNFSGETLYKTDSQKVAPSLMFYLYHPKNISMEGDIGSVLITLQSEQKINEIESTFNYVTITVNMVARNYTDGNSYDASITYDKKYDMPSATSVNITNRSQFTVYYSLYAKGKLKEIYGEDYNNYHVLTSSYAFPVGTQITMLDFGYDINNPQYYYFDVTDEVYQNSIMQLATEGEITYKLSDFVRMGSTSKNNTYDDYKANQKYYDGNSTAMEEFIFIIDLKETTMTGEHLANSLLFELRDPDDIEVITVLGIRRQLMEFSLYDSSNVVLQEKINNASEYLYYNIENYFDFQTIVGYNQTGNGASIIDTNYESSAMGLNVYVFDKNDNQVSSSLLTGTVLSIDGESIFVDGDGVFRAKLAGKVSNLSKNISLLIDKKLPAGQYKLRFVLFASADGKHNSSLEDSAIVDVNVTVIGDDNAIKVITNDKTKVVDGRTGFNSLGSKVNTYVLRYRSVLANPNVRVSLYKRDITDKDTMIYNEVDFNMLFTNSLSSPSGSNYLYEKSLPATVNSDNTYGFELKTGLISGTYKLVFRLYDGAQPIEEENEYIIVTKDIVKES